MMIIASLSWKGSPGTSPASATLFKALADHADEKGFCFPSVERLSRWCQHNVRTTRRAMEELKRSGWVKVVKRGRNHEYYLNLTMLCEGVLARGEKLTTQEASFVHALIGDKLSAVATDAMRPTQDNLSAIGSKGDTQTPDNVSAFDNTTPDISGSDSGQTRMQHRTNQVTIADISGRYIENRQEPSLEPSGELSAKQKRPPVSQHDKVTLARAMFEHLAITASEKTLNFAAEAIRMQAEGLKLSLHESMLLIRRQAELAPDRGETVNWMWFEDSRWKTSRVERQGFAEPPTLAPEQPPTGVDIESGDRVWTGMSKAAKGVVGPQCFDTWIRPIKAKGILDGVLYLQIPSDDFSHVPARYDFAQYLPAGVNEVRILNAMGVAA